MPDVRDAIRSMLVRYECRSGDDYVNALREILQDLALLGLWRSKFFEHAAFYGGTALRVLHGLDRYSEDLDFSLLRHNPSFSLGAYGEAMQREISSFGFRVTFTQRHKEQTGAIESAFLKANTYTQLIEVEAREELLRDLHPGRTLKIKLEVDTDPPLGFQTESQYVLLPVPFAVRVYCLPDLLAGKLHAVLCRRWKTRVKGRDWYDLVWYTGRHPEVRLSHLETRMRQSGDYREPGSISPSMLNSRLHSAVDSLDVGMARREVAPFVGDPRGLDIWSADFFHHIVDQIIAV
jgi:predicted nucleotidyltransferase component of viral defense system